LSSSWNGHFKSHVKDKNKTPHKSPVGVEMIPGALAVAVTACRPGIQRASSATAPLQQYSCPLSASTHQLMFHSEPFIGLDLYDFFSSLWEGFLSAAAKKCDLKVTFRLEPSKT
jgi:hypothetical protein